ncbi:hypothetical protein YPPY34_3861 [Yersinia pestis PY-34]|uniref:Uncharacterized protein n=1 Tax=Yersinia pestis biovar Orientalis str. IP275 TaxID=373665 RepID=A0AAV3BKP5_YERPE|nr:hypothetical protein YpAngola_A0981 [Yersinia pestis Angola]EDR33858.1 hypothetical protein YPIP275_4149 [Yersinia pestis biovar Orientalis str. IP275]EDR39575.1 hypothetical protein YpF1991016_2557 [Yersinia pestis biovar Orientalis str. F1991016]EDR43353.1 hypothetical protein YpE1979001_2233 [Yersinia pestis biovar Antiqua str. E1979001]EDR49169.1 hypothetical protein YpB42003004_2706 [Yersinia pestis biovar Antiqua str. B42003004]EDR57303.1 hypothetical protein YpMG051020_4364 [Yersinia
MISAPMAVFTTKTAQNTVLLSVIIQYINVIKIPQLSVK